MWRYLVGAVGALLLAGAGTLLFRGAAAPPRLLPAMAMQAGSDAAMPDGVPEATDRTREEKRFNRYDKDRDGKIMRDEYLASRRKAYAKLDTNHDGTLQFDEWAAKAETKFASADADHNGAMTAAEFATTAVKRKPAGGRDCAREPAPADEDKS